MNLNTQTLDNHWQEIMGKLHEKWGTLKEEELRDARGNVEQLVGTIQRRTGETRDSIQRFLDEIGQSYSGTAQQAADAIRNFAGRAAESMQGAMHGASEQAAETMRTSMKQTRQVVRQHPMESLLTCFGAGVVTGIVVGILLRPR